MKKIKILIVDDERQICDLTKSLLGRRNYVCFSADAPAEAVELVKKEHPDLVLLDVRLGEISGLEVLAKIKELDSKIKVIMVTGLGDEVTVSEAKSLGADDYITKPFTADYLCNLISTKITKSEV
jgi:DNA-binding response OmpR family regulator